MSAAKKIQAIIFDMDGVLIDSEHLWQQTERSVFGELGFELTDELLVETRGLRTEEMLAHWSARFPMEGIEMSTLMQDYDARMVETMLREVPLMEGARELISFFRDRGLPVALATCSTREHIDAVMEKHGLRDSFELLVSAARNMQGKPHPEVYLHTAEKLKVDPTRCLAFEDSFFGVISAKAARMKVVAMPDRSEYDQLRFGAADLKIRSLTEFTPETFEKLQ